MDFHPISHVFPMMQDEDLQSLANDIADNGLKEPVTTFEGKVLDGRNRLAACAIAGVTPTFQEFDGTLSEALAHSWSVNRQRRHLNSSQAAIAESKRAKLDEQYASEVARMKAEANKARGGDRKSEKSREQKISAGNNSGTDRRTREQSQPRSQRAAAAGTNPRYITDADKIVERHPEVAAEIELGNLTIPEAKREIARKLASEGLPGGLSVRAEALRQPGVRWTKALYKLSVLIASVTEHGSIESLAEKWEKSVRKDYADKLREIVRTLQSWIKSLEAK